MSSQADKLRHSYQYESALQELTSLQFDGRPSSILEAVVKKCLKPGHQERKGKLSVAEYVAVLKKRNELDAAEETLFNVSSQILAEQKKRKKIRSVHRSCKRISPYYFDDSGEKVTLAPTETTWYLLYIKCCDSVTECPKFAKKFRRRFRMPHSEFKQLLFQLNYDGQFARWKEGSTDAVGRPATPLGLLLLGALRYLGRGLTFDDLEEYTAVAEETHRQFFHVFIEWGSTVLFKQHVKCPTNAEEYSLHQNEFTVGGLPGAGWSADATNVLMWRCDHNLRQAHMGFKNSHPARTYNLTTNHRREILHTTTGHPSRWNDKTLVLFDSFISGIHEGKKLQDVKFELEDRLPDGKVTKVSYRGAWGLTDNGYHRWSCTQAPSKCNVLVSELKLSEWIESFRKDAECVFGILKGCFRILQTGIRLHGTMSADRVWLTCCGLHNLLLKSDG
jgi:DDE superfamily endonuclease